MSCVPKDLRKGCAIFLGEFNEALLEGGEWNKNLFHF